MTLSPILSSSYPFESHLSLDQINVAKKKKEILDPILAIPVQAETPSTIDPVANSMHKVKKVATPTIDVCLEKKPPVTYSKPVIVQIGFNPTRGKGKKFNSSKILNERSIETCQAIVQIGPNARFIGPVIEGTNIPFGFGKIIDGTKDRVIETVVYDSDYKTKLKNIFDSQNKRPARTFSIKDFFAKSNAMINKLKSVKS